MHAGRGTPFRYSMRELNDMLRPGCAELFVELVPDARREGRRLVGHASDGSKLSMVVSGAMLGTWGNWHRPEEKGGPINLVQHLLFRGNRALACAWARERLGLGDGIDDTAITPEAREQLRRQQEQAVRRRTWQEDQDRRRRTERALDFWSAGRPDSDEVRDYLATRLGFTRATLPWRLSHLRFARRVKAPWNPDNFAAMLTPIVSVETARQAGVHVTLLTERGGHWRKAPVAEPKRTFGTLRNVCLPLLVGASRGSIMDARKGETLVLGEGVENTLGAAWVRDDAPRAWAMSSIGVLPTLKLPKAVARVVLVEDNDEHNQTVTTLRERAIDAWLREGRQVEWLRAPPRFKDMAEFLLAERETDG